MASGYKADAAQDKAISFARRGSDIVVEPLAGIVESDCIVRDIYDTLLALSALVQTQIQTGRDN